jgi:hypothetical protein
MRRAQRGRIAIACIATCTWLATAAQEPSGAWRCGNTYTDRPCEGGKAIGRGDAPDSDQAREAQDDTRRIQAAADRMERDRLRQERAQARQPGLAHFPNPSNQGVPEEVRETSAKRKKKGRKEPDFFTASGPGSTARKRAPKAGTGE